MKQKNCNRDIIHLLERGCELEDIKSLLPEEYNCELEQLIKNNRTNKTI